MIIIETKYHGPTNYRGARISATTPTWPGLRAGIPYPHELDGVACHEGAALALLEKINARPPASMCDHLSLEPNGWDGKPRVASAGDRGYYFIARTGNEE